MLASALFAAAVIAAIAALRYDDVRQRRRISALEDGLRKLWARQDRLTNMVKNEGWRDSRLLTTFDWRRPTKF